MSLIRSIIFSVLVCFGASASAQDTLLFKDATKRVVILKEVLQAEIRYQKYNAPDGPVYVVGKTEVEKIIYKSGVVEVLAPPAEAKPQPLPGYYQAVAIPYKGKIDHRDIKKGYKALRGLAIGHPDPVRQQKLLEMVLPMRNIKTGQDASRTGAVLFWTVGVSTLVYYFVENEFAHPKDNTLLIPPITFGAMAAGLTALSVTFNVKLRKKRTEFIRLYNE